MLEKLKEYREQFGEELLEIETANDEEYIAEQVKAYEADLRSSLAEKRKKAVADKQSEIAVLDKLIALETEKIASEKSPNALDNFFQAAPATSFVANVEENC